MLLNFKQVVENESRYPGLYYRRVENGKSFDWTIHFDPAKAGVIKQYADNQNEAAETVELYHHDFADGRWIASVTRLPPKKRWKVTISYFNMSDHIVEIDEIGDLEQIVEDGPDYRLLTNMAFEYNQ